MRPGLRFLLVGGHAWISGAISFLALMMVGTQARAFTQECIMRGAAVGKGYDLKEGDLVYNRWPDAAGPSLFIIANDRFREVFGINHHLVDCQSVARESDYPVILSADNDEERLMLFTEFGIWVDNPFFGTGPQDKKKFLHNCFYIGDGHVSFRVAEKTYHRYKQQGFNSNNLCLALTSGAIRFDPETGERLPTYVFISSTHSASKEFPFFVPRCFGHGRTKVEPQRGGATMKPIGCVVKYHPWSGRELRPAESKFFTREASLEVAGDEGPLPSDTDNFAEDQSRRVTEAKIQAIKAQQAAGSAQGK